MKYKVGDKVRIKSKEWWDAQPKIKGDCVDCGEYYFTGKMTTLCGKVVEIAGLWSNSYDLKECPYHWTDEMFDDSYNPEKSIINEEMIKDIAEVIKKHNLGVSVSENGGKLLVEPLKIEDKQELEFGSPVMVSDGNEYWYFTNYGGGDKAFIVDRNGKYKSWKYIIEFEKFNPYNPEESLKYNVVK